MVDLPPLRSFSPDAGFYIGKIDTQFLEGPPLFAVEVRNEADYGPYAERVIARKRADYLLQEH